MKKEERLHFYKSKLTSLAEFLENYLPLANAHTVDFHVDDMWLSNVPELIQKELLDLSHEELVALPQKMLENFAEDLEDGKQNNDSIVKTNECGDDEHLKRFKTSCEKCSERRPKLNRQQKCTWKHKNLRTFVKSAHKHTLQGLGVLSTKDSLLLEEGKSFQMNDFMCAKKAHEVELMASLCASLCKKHNTEQVVDIGSGLGYLSGHMAFLYNLKVLGIDSSNSNTHGADKRSARLTKHWPLLLANVQLSQLGLAPVRTKGRKKLKHLQKSEKENMLDSLEDVKPEDYIPPEKFASLASKLKLAKQLSPKGHFQPVTMYVTQETNLVELLRLNFGDVQVTDPKTVSDNSKECGNSYDIDSLLEESHDLAISENTSPSGNEKKSFALTGLHTCGGLASSVLKLFLSNTNAVCISNVGCCYHLIDEEFIRSPFEKDDDPDPTEFGFPLSHCLLDSHYYLGRNARMLACQAPSRLSSASDNPDKKGPERSIHWRAVLQVILNDIMGETRDDWSIGKLASKCTSFIEYVRKALLKLNIDHELSDLKISEYERKFEQAERYMKCFFYLRATLAACIESIILLDRLVFLLEQDCVTESYLVELFDPKTSPRCWALIASK